MAYINVRILSIHGQITSQKTDGFSPARYVGRGPKKNMLGRYQYPLHKASELGNARLGAAKRNTGLNYHRFGDGGEFPGGRTRQVLQLRGARFVGKSHVVFFTQKVR